jgi:hypothetical protein
MCVDLQHDKTLFMKPPIVHPAEKLDHDSRLQTTANLRQAKVVGKARAQCHG